MPRLFVALRPPEPVRDALLDAMGGVEGARWQSDDQLHLTLRFVGDIPPPDAEDLAAELGRVRAAPFALKLSGTGQFARKGRPHTLWAGVAPSPDLAALQAKVERACQRAGLPPEGRKFAAHVTLARLSGAAGPTGAWLAQAGPFRAPEWPVDAFQLVESTLGTGGSHYEPVVQYPLRP
ncbi:RNA 2',3'-cyclic phosphodiesterase [Altererythrobacter sp. TH136]|uniref:RNA 2',3'-cyclic phosphodiesterase n=1 Tax=Altererythrobacter sp. TH136 TaxID=2067415 RepID=UPI001162E058|nr:RNA 2',3'-cyclic phosphodiesterase [Altererythrobacter sp. TH136]QDM39677.1 RNA 2',3'-cyclic phosphodiesterase [Altererythrobacter sp. TH136]